MVQILDHRFNPLARGGGIRTTCVSISLRSARKFQSPSTGRGYSDVSSVKPKPTQCNGFNPLARGGGIRTRRHSMSRQVQQVSFNPLARGGGIRTSCLFNLQRTWCFLFQSPSTGRGYSDTVILFLYHGKPSFNPLARGGSRNLSVSSCSLLHKLLLLF